MKWSELDRQPKTPWKWLWFPPSFSEQLHYKFVPCLFLHRWRSYPVQISFIVGDCWATDATWLPIVWEFILYCTLKQRNCILICQMLPCLIEHYFICTQALGTHCIPYCHITGTSVLRKYDWLIDWRCLLMKLDKSCTNNQYMHVSITFKLDEIITVDHCIFLG